MRKQFPAFLAAFLMTGLMALAMTVVTVNALVNRNSTPVADTSAANTGTEAMQVAQLQDLVQQYQQREQEYQQRDEQYQEMLSQEQQQLDTANQQLDQFKQFLRFLQQRGVLSIDEDGQITINR